MNIYRTFRDFFQPTSVAFYSTLKAHLEALKPPIQAANFLCLMHWDICAKAASLASCST